MKKIPSEPSSLLPAFSSVLLSGGVLFPEIAVAATTAPANFKELVEIFTDLISVALPVIAGLAFLAFLWGLAKFVFRIGGDEKAVAEGKKFMVWALIALFIMVSLWGIISFASRDIGFI